MPGHCGVGERELELHPADGHTVDGMAVLVPWASVLIAGDYLSPVEIPWISEGGSASAYLATLARLEPLLERVEHVVPGHGAVLDAERALAILREDRAYLQALLGARRRRRAAARAAHRRDAEDPRRERGARRRRYSGALITARVSPAETAAPSEIGSSATTPALWAVISFSIFIASMMQTSAPSSTVAPCSTSTLKTLPWSGEASVSPPPPAAADRRSRPLRRLGAPRRGAVAGGRGDRVAEHAHVEPLAGHLDRVGALQRLGLVVLGAARRLRERQRLEPRPVLDQVAAGLGRGPLRPRP